MAKMGRPSIKDDLDFKQAGKLYIKGWIDAEVADFYGVTLRTVENWKRNDPDFFHTLKNAKKEADGKVVKSLFQRALGYDYTEIHRERRQNRETGKYEIVETKQITKQVVADTTAIIFWLKNRQPGDWRDKKEIDVNHQLTEKEREETIGRIGTMLSQRN